jgi:hypothetical protein
VSLIIVASLLGNAYMVTSIGYPAYLESFGDALLIVGYVAMIPPALVFGVLQKLGLAWELRGRESFIESNLTFWIYCVAFYTLLFFAISRVWHRLVARRAAGQRGHSEPHAGINGSKG